MANDVLARLRQRLTTPSGEVTPTIRAGSHRERCDECGLDFDDHLSALDRRGRRIAWCPES